MSCAQWKVPALISVGVICFAIGIGAGAVGDAALGDYWKKTRSTNSGEGDAADPGGQGQLAPGKATGIMAKMGKGKGKMGGPMGKMGGFAPSSKNQLAALVTKLDQLTHKPLTISFSEEKRAKLGEQLVGLEKKEELSEVEAKERLDAILEIMKDDRPTLEAAGYRWPAQGGGGFRPPPNDPNPFTSEENSKHLKSLQEQVAKEKGK
jgi:hypothetical protein